MSNTISELQSNAEAYLGAESMVTSAGRNAARDLVNALTIARRNQSNLLEANAQVKMLQLAVEQVQAELRVKEAELLRTTRELVRAERGSDAAHDRHTATIRNIKGGKAKVVAKLREARAALQTIKDVVEENGVHVTAGGAATYKIIRAYADVLED